MTNAHATSPPRTVGVAGLIGIAFFCVAGGPYGLEDAVGAAGPAVALLALLLVPWVWALPMALLTAELSSALPEDGGYVVWVERAFGRFWGFQEGWWSWLCSFADNALYPVLFASYLKFWWPTMTFAQQWWVCLAVIAVCTLLNVRGVQLVGATSILFTLLIIAPFVVFVWQGLGSLNASVLTDVHALPQIDWKTLLVVALWNYSGWDNVGCCAGEVRDPGRTFPRALFATLGLIILMYVLPVAVGACASPQWDRWSDGHFSEVARQLGGARFADWLTVCGMISALGLLNALLLTSSRVPLAMATRGTLPRALTRRHPRFHTPWVSILLNAIGCAALIGWAIQAENDRGPFVALLEIDMWLYALALLLEFAALIRLRQREPELPRPYAIPGGLIMVVLMSMLPVLLCVASLALCPRKTQVLGLIGVATGLVAYRVFKPSAVQGGGTPTQ